MSHRKPLYWIVLFISAATVYIAAGPALTGATNIAEWYPSWQRSMFDLLCHQRLDRTIMVSGVPMAVCARCFGIYTAFLVGILMLPFLPQGPTRNKLIIPILLAGLFLNIADVLAYALTAWENTLSSRYVAGALIGLPAAILTGTQNPITNWRSYSYGNQN